MIRRRLVAALLLAGVLALAGCVTAPPTLPSAGPWAERLAALSGLDHWTVEGRIAVNKAAEGWTASLLWTQRGVDYTIDLIGPLGQGRLRIQGDATGVQARTADGQLYRDDDPARLLERATGVQ
ncbi:MAG: outer membrane lipoprotein LolB, partial [Pseudomonadota bacterium]|nr:outer membrane lipoprotein LolB [Pseudomonadota bacterium]